MYCIGLYRIVLYRIVLYCIVEEEDNVKVWWGGEGGEGELSS